MYNCKTNPLGFHVYPPDRVKKTLKPCECGAIPSEELINHFVTRIYGDSEICQECGGFTYKCKVFGHIKNGRRDNNESIEF